MTDSLRQDIQRLFEHSDELIRRSEETCARANEVSKQLSVVMALSDKAVAESEAILTKSRRSREFDGNKKRPSDGS